MTLVGYGGALIESKTLKLPAASELIFVRPVKKSGQHWSKVLETTVE